MPKSENHHHGCNLIGGDGCLLVQLAFSAEEVSGDACCGECGRSIADLDREAQALGRHIKSAAKATRDILAIQRIQQLALSIPEESSSTED